MFKGLIDVCRKRRSLFVFDGAKIGRFRPMENTPSARFLYHKCGKSAIKSCFIVSFWCRPMDFFAFFCPRTPVFRLPLAKNTPKKKQRYFIAKCLCRFRKICLTSSYGINFSRWRSLLEVLCRHDSLQGHSFQQSAQRQRCNLIFKPIQTLLPAYQL